MWDLGVDYIKKKKKILAELGHSERLIIYADPSKIYIDPRIEVSSNDVFSKTTAPMVLKFHMQHDEAAGLQNDEIQPCRESKNGRCC